MLNPSILFNERPARHRPTPCLGSRLGHSQGSPIVGAKCGFPFLSGLACELAKPRSSDDAVGVGPAHEGVPRTLTARCHRLP